MIPDADSVVKFLLYCISAAVLGWSTTGIVLRLATGGRLVAEPSERGLHRRIVPVGGGLGFIGSAATIWVLWAGVPGNEWQLAIVCALIGLIAVSVIDDVRSLPPMVRLTAQVAAVAAALWYVPADLRIVPWLPPQFERLLVGFLWVWLVNAVNFMDGSDGFAAVEGISVASGYAIVASRLGAPEVVFPGLEVFALLLASALAGFLIWNWAPARIFMGDTGSIPLGFIIGLFALDLALRGAWQAALILPLYFVVDATLTLLRRMARRERFWEAHREHAYQRAILAGATHSEVAIRLAVLNAALIGLAVVSLVHPLWALIGAAGVTLLLFGSLSIRGAGATSAKAR